MSPTMKAGIALLASGAAVGLAGGIGFGLAAKSANDGILDEAKNHAVFDPSLEDSVHLYQNLMIASIALGGALAVTGAVLTGIGAKAASSPSSDSGRSDHSRLSAPSIRITPFASAHNAGALLEGRF
jgi:hypothetical protein